MTRHKHFVIAILVGCSLASHEALAQEELHLGVHDYVRQKLLGPIVKAIAVKHIEKAIVQAVEETLKQADKYGKNHPEEMKILNRCIGFVESVHRGAPKPLEGDQVGEDIYQWCMSQLTGYDNVAFTDIIMTLRKPTDRFEDPFKEDTVVRYESKIPAAKVTNEYEELADSGLIEKAYEDLWTTYHVMWKSTGFEGKTECLFRGYFLARPRNELDDRNKDKSPVLGVVTMKFALLGGQWSPNSVVVTVAGREATKMPKTRKPLK